jgi:hypothetical protein
MSNQNEEPGFKNLRAQGAPRALAALNFTGVAGVQGASIAVGVYTVQPQWHSHPWTV